MVIIIWRNKLGTWSIRERWPSTCTLLYTSTRTRILEIRINNLKWISWWGKERPASRQGVILGFPSLVESMVIGYFHLTGWTRNQSFLGWHSLQTHWSIMKLVQPLPHPASHPRELGSMGIACLIITLTIDSGTWWEKRPHTLIDLSDKRALFYWTVLYIQNIRWHGNYMNVR